MHSPGQEHGRCGGGGCISGDLSEETLLGDSAVDGGGGVNVRSSFSK